ncbi:hypothetical protein ES703_75314 [subsurface metagenome]
MELEEAKLTLKKIVEKVIAETKSVSPLFRDDVHVRYKIDSVTKDENGVITGASWNTEGFTQISTTPFQVWLSEYEKEREYLELLDKLCDCLQCKKEKIMYPLNKLLTEQVLNGVNIGELDLFIEEALGKLPNWSMVALMSGIIPVETSIELKKDVKLRPVSEEDLSYESSGILGVRLGFAMPLPHSILELSLEEAYPNQLQHALQDLIIILSLYQVAAISYKNYTMDTNSFFQFGEGTLSSGKNYSDKPILFLKSTDVELITKYIDRIEPLISELDIRSDPKTSIEITVKRYLDSVRLTTTVDEKILQAIMGLEALFLTGGSEARFRLSLRVSQIMDLLNEDSLRVYSNLLKAYEYRSSYVHGSQIKSRNRIHAQNILFEIQNYLRKSILLFLMLNIKTKNNKSTFLKAIDESLINPDKKEELVEKIKKTNENIWNIT